MNLKSRNSRRTFLSQFAGVVSASAVLPLFGDERTPPVVNIADRLRQQVNDAPLAMRLKDMTSDECRLFQTQFGAKLKESLGANQPPKLSKTTVLGSALQEGYRRDELLLESEGLPPLPLYLLVPDAAKRGRRPCVLALHGHGEFGHHPVAGRDDLPGVEKAIASANYDYGRQLARRGYLVACPCFTPFGDRLGSRQPFKQRDPCDVGGQIECSQRGAELAAGLFGGVDNRWKRYEGQVSAGSGACFFRLPLGGEPVGGMAGFASSTSALAPLASDPF